MNWTSILLVLGVLTTMTSCELKFGNDVELSGAAFDKVKLAEVSSRTGVQFPTGAVGLEYRYLGSGIDDALAAKIRIPDEEVGSFMKNAVFSSGADARPNIQIGKGKPWWKINELTERIDRSQDLPHGQFLEVTCGREGAHFVVYLSWMTS